MAKIDIDKNTRDLIDQHRQDYRLRGNPDVSREEMLKLLLEYGNKALTETHSQRRHEKGLVCFGPGEQVRHMGVVSWPEPRVAAGLFLGHGGRLVLVYGRPGSGVSTYINAVKAINAGDTEVFDMDEGGNSVNIVGAMLAFEQGRKAIVAVTADTHQEVLSLLARYSSRKWLESYEAACALRQFGTEPASIMA